jgi:acyl-CoA dehydrogenase
VTEASIILEEINRSGGNAGACHAQMYTMGTLLRHGSRAEARVPAEDRRGELRLQAFGVTEPTTGSDTTQMKTTRRRKAIATSSAARSLDLPRGAFRSAAARARTTPIARGEEADGGLSCSSSICGRRSARPDDPADPHDDEPAPRPSCFFDDLAVPATALVGEEGQGFSLLDRRPQCRADSDCGGMPSATAAGSSSAPPNTRRAGSCSTARFGQNQGRAVSDRDART